MTGSKRLLVAALATAATVVAATAAIGSTAAPRVGSDPLCNPALCKMIHDAEGQIPPTDIASWTGKVNEYKHEDYQTGFVTYQVDAYSTSCADAGVDTTDFTGSTCSADVQANFEITTEEVNGKNVNVCTPKFNTLGFNATETFTDSLGNAYPAVSGVAYLSTTYTDDEALPVGAEAHFHFEGAKQDTAASRVMEETATAVGLRACTHAASKLPATSAGDVYATHS